MSEKVTGREPEEEDGCARSLEAKLAEEEGEEGDTHRTGGPLTTLGLPAKAPHQGNLSSPIMFSLSNRIRGFCLKSPKAFLLRHNTRNLSKEIITDRLLTCSGFYPWASAKTICGRKAEEVL